MAKFRKKKDINLGKVSIGESDIPSKVDDNNLTIKNRQKEIEEDTARKVEEYRKENPEEPVAVKKASPIEAPLKLKRTIGSFDGEYVEIAKRYLGLHSSNTPTVVELSKAIIKLFEDNAKLYKELNRLRENSKNTMNAPVRHSWEHNSSWN